jgi:hypothetical protein
MQVFRVRWGSRDVALKLNGEFDGSEPVPDEKIKDARSEHLAAFVAGNGVMRMLALYRGPGPSEGEAHTWVWESPHEAHGAVYELAEGGSLQDYLYKTGS